jgi:hypothetical protein
MPRHIECRVIDIIRKHNTVILEGVAAYVDTSRKRNEPSTPSATAHSSWMAANLTEED